MQIDQTKIDRYLLGELEEAELQAFEAQLQADPKLQKEVETQREIVSGIEYANNQEVKTILKGIHQKVVEQPKAAPEPAKPKSRTWVIAAAIVILLGLLVYWFAYRGVSADQLYEQYYQPYAWNQTRTAEQGSVVQIAGEFYNKKDYEAALPYLQALSQQKPQEGKWLLYMGIAHMELDQTKDSKAAFQQLIDRNDPLYADHARWYLALLYLKNEQVDQAKPLLEELAGDDAADYSEEAKGLLKAW